MAAVCVIANPEGLKDYFLRKVAQGRHKMKVINNVRNKLVHRVLACVKDGPICVKSYNVELTLI